jgi:hypothetical protein
LTRSAASLLTAAHHRAQLFCCDSGLGMKFLILGFWWVLVAHSLAKITSSTFVAANATADEHEAHRSNHQGDEGG